MFLLLLCVICFLTAVLIVAILKNGGDADKNSQNFFK
jgi:hypothetical protein